MNNVFKALIVTLLIISFSNVYKEANASASIYINTERYPYNTFTWTDEYVFILTGKHSSDGWFPKFFYPTEYAITRLTRENRGAYHKSISEINGCFLNIVCSEKNLYVVGNHLDTSVPGLFIYTLSFEGDLVDEKTVAGIDEYIGSICLKDRSLYIATSNTIYDLNIDTMEIKEIFKTASEKDQILFRELDHIEQYGNALVFQVNNRVESLDLNTFISTELYNWEDLPECDPFLSVDGKMDIFVTKNHLCVDNHDNQLILIDIDKFLTKEIDFVHEQILQLTDNGMLFIIDKSSNKAVYCKVLLDDLGQIEISEHEKAFLPIDSILIGNNEYLTASVQCPILPGNSFYSLDSASIEILGNYR